MNMIQKLDALLKAYVSPTIKLALLATCILQLCILKAADEGCLNIMNFEFLKYLTSGSAGTFQFLQIQPKRTGLLHQFVEQHEDGIEVVYVISGWSKAEPGCYSVRLFRKAKLEGLHPEHIYLKF